MSTNMMHELACCSTICHRNPPVLGFSHAPFKAEWCIWSWYVILQAVWLRNQCFWIIFQDKSSVLWGLMSIRKLLALFGHIHITSVISVWSIFLHKPSGLWPSVYLPERMNDAICEELEKLSIVVSKVNDVIQDQDKYVKYLSLICRDLYI